MRLAILPLAALFATTAFAHQGVKNPAVMARMEGMSTIADATKTLSQIAKGQGDIAAAAAARATLIAEAARIDALFQAPETDPKTEARPAIWENYADFVEKAEALRVAAEALDPASPATIGAGLPAIGQTCRACHGDYRID